MTRDLASIDAEIHIAGVRDAIEELLDHLQYETRRVKEPGARALLGGTTELLQDLVTTYTRYETAKQEVVRKHGAVSRPARVLAFGGRKQLARATSL